MSASRGAVVITGASTGIGEACALHLDARGWRVFAGVRRDADGARLRASASERLVPLRIDVTDQGSLDAAAALVAGAVGQTGLAGLVNNAGVALPGPLEFLSRERLRDQFEVNVIGLVATTQAFMPSLRRARGRIVNMGSISGRLATPFVGPYAMTKHALEAYSDALRVELHPWKLHVALIEPGTIATPIWDKGMATADAVLAEIPEEAHRLYDAQMTPARETMYRLGRAGIPPERVADAVAHALESRRPKTRYVVGRDAKIEAMLRRWLPDRVLDFAVRRQLGI